jgi:hypothetical protein
MRIVQDLSFVIHVAMSGGQSLGAELDRILRLV